MQQTVVPFRNAILLSIATGVAESWGASGVVIAAHGGDHAIYPDCREVLGYAIEKLKAVESYIRDQVSKI